MNLKLKPPFPPMEALSVEKIPGGAQWQYEPKWDGFRCLVFRNGENIELQSKSGQSLTRYFPELVAALSFLKAKQFILDGEITIPIGKKLSFDDLLLRLHPAESRIQKLAKEHPAILIVFDLLADEKGRVLVDKPLEERRSMLEAFAEKYFPSKGAIRLSPVTRDIAKAQQWLGAVGNTLGGVIAKRLDFPYCSGERTGMQKIKRIRTVDCVVGGFRYGTGKPVVGSLLLGLYDENGLLHHVGFTSGLKQIERKQLTKTLEALIKSPGFTGRAPGGPSRWSSERSGEWQPLEPKLVVEVSYDHFTGGRFRHGTKFLRWRPDKSPQQCGMDQVIQAEPKPMELLK